MTEELEETISNLKGDLLDMQELILKKDREILWLGDEMKRLKKALEKAQSNSVGENRQAGSNSQQKATTYSLQDSDKLGKSGKSGTQIESPKQLEQHGTKPVDSVSPEPKPMAPPTSTVRSTTPTTASSTASLTKKEWTPYERKDPLMEFDDIPGMDDYDAHLDELLNGGRPTTPPPVSQKPEAVVQATTPVRAKSAPQVLGTPEKTRQKNLDILHQARQNQLQEQRKEEERKEYERRNLVIKPVESMVKREQDHGAFARSMIEKTAKSKSQHDTKEKQLQKKLDNKAAELSGKRIGKQQSKDLLTKFFRGGREERERGVLAIGEDTAQQENDPFADEEDIYSMNENQMFYQGKAEDPAALRREADMKKKDLDETSLFFLRERFLSPEEIDIMTEDMKVFSVTECLRAARGGTDMDEPSFAVCGVITSANVQMYNYGGSTRKVIKMRIADLATLKEEWTVSLSCRKDATDRCLHWRPGSVVILVNPVLERFYVTNKDSGKKQEETGFSINSGDSNLAFEIGMTADIGRCEANTRSGEQCKRVIYKRKLDVCIQHAEIREREKKKKEQMAKNGVSRLKTIDGSSAPPTSTRSEFNSVPSLVKGTKITSFKPQGQPMQSKSFKRPAEEELRRQRRENEKITEELLKSNPRVAETVFGKQDSKRVPLPKHMSQHRHPDDIKVSRYQDDKRMSDYVLQKPDRKKAKSASSTASNESCSIPTGPRAMTEGTKSVVAEAARKQVLLARNQGFLDDDSDSDGLEIV
ncbi:hypothetical protein B0I73DRAFT_128727 [Yarrowia lipolytica]|jgi:hypothetical protein|uniref:YALI0D08888p n=2 Tax=Yarrowia lipolytica TaxID=4952 RepID=Q6C9R8_YARLI|nr:YALI0D08888p [Yarrowia lipolytica CLIB122]AOW03803.1 hypothetical protein YALI1_D11368g [Yarrowia lipolytica]KAB8284295.1 hypothetical protein BKA91DRAFT_135097 [Yarrowia lipolytica]KAE8169222.1 hypothetical protein BKA90DRAFT_142975 [Yarrowia lipolytica]KAJ8054612.1 hypothetical protein LXG23DRAFT_56168 [Yarrowia lipolytica]RDW24867.1 hypothetical protein B0I71DRAFT_133536 [Yarrowia lipolytica]|eukprot:XP_502594.1 YALI0D08888p [Yarrowia lipolytica CLIB122]